MIVAAMREQEHPCHGAGAGRMGGGTDTDIVALHATARLDSLVGRNTAYSRISSVSHAAFAGSAAPWQNSAATAGPKPCCRLPQALPGSYNWPLVPAIHHPDPGEGKPQEPVH